MKIGIISDTHRKVKKAHRAIETLKSDGAEFIIHAGDIVELETLEILKRCGLRYVAVYGNNDAHLVEHHNNFELVQEPYHFKLANAKFKLMHLPFYMSGDADIVVFGHTHVSSIQFINGVLFINSGEVCARNKPISQWMMLDVDDERFIVTKYERKNKSQIIEKSEFTYERKS